MKTIETKLFSFNELSPEAKSRVIEREAERVELDYSDMNASLKAICKACNLHLNDYAYGPSCQGHRILVSGSDDELEGHKALAWFLKILIENGYSRPRTFKEMTFPGVCGFTGVCYDDTIAKSVWKSLLEGETVRHAFDSVSGTLCESCEDELEYLQSEECILDYLDQDAEIYTENGTEF